MSTKCISIFINIFLSFWYVQKRNGEEIELPYGIGVTYFLDHAFYEVVIKIFVYFLITNPSWYENIVNLFEHDMET